MSRRIGRLEEIFNINVPPAAVSLTSSPSSSSSSSSSSPSATSSPIIVHRPSSSIDHQQDNKKSDNGNETPVSRPSIESLPATIDDDLSSDINLNDSNSQNCLTTSANPIPPTSSSSFFINKHNQNSSSDGGDGIVNNVEQRSLDNFDDSLNFIRSYSVDQDNTYSSAGGGGVSRSRGNVRRWSQTMRSSSIKNAKKPVRSKTINRMPSRMQGLSIEGLHVIDRDTEIDQLTHEIEKHDHLMDDTAFSEQLRMETLRALPQSLTTKRQIKEKLTSTIRNQSQQHQITEYKRLKYKFSMWLNRTRISTKNNLNNIELWYGPMKEIEGHFGSAVGTYFKFLRWLFTLDFSLLILAFSFIVIPQILYNNVSSGEGNSTAAVPFHFGDLFTAQGYLMDSVLFYGAYTNESLVLINNQPYSLPNAYFMTMIVLYILTFIIVSIAMARSYRHSFIETSGGVPNLYAHKIFCSWDFGITNNKAAQVKHNSIFNELKEVLNELHHKPDKPTKVQAFWTICSQLVAHLFVLCVISALGLGLWQLLKIIGDEQQLATENDGNLLNLSSLSSLYVALVVNFTLLVLQFIFAWVASMEDYKSARLKVHITLFRNYLLEVVIVGVLLVFWLTKGYSDCWETSIGQEIYRIVIVDFIVFVLGGAMIHAIRFLIFRYFYRKIGLPEFNISSSSLGLVFNQTLLWVGLLFSPPLAGIVSIKMMITFYLKKNTLIYFCKTPSKLWRSAQTSTLFLVMVFVSLLGVSIVNGYIITQVNVSPVCGPFRGHSFIYQNFIEGMLKLKESHWFWRIFIAITRPAVIGGILLLMCVIAYYLRSKSKARIGMVKILKEMLYLEAKDKEFLLSNITKITEGRDWLFEDGSVVGVNSGNAGNCDLLYTESTSTWNYRGVQLNNDDKLSSKKSSSRESVINNGDYKRLSDEQLNNVRNRRY